MADEVRIWPAAEAQPPSPSFGGGVWPISFEQRLDGLVHLGAARAGGPDQSYASLRLAMVMTNTVAAGSLIV
jgi:hypothetical protein